MKLSGAMAILNEMLENEPELEVPTRFVTNIVACRLFGAEDGSLNTNYLSGFTDEDDVFGYLIKELKIEPTSKVQKAYSKAYESHHAYGVVEVVQEFLDLLDVLEIPYAGKD